MKNLQERLDDLEGRVINLEKLTGISLRVQVPESGPREDYWIIVSRHKKYSNKHLYRAPGYWTTNPHEALRYDKDAAEAESNGFDKPSKDHKTPKAVQVPE